MYMQSLQLKERTNIVGQTLWYRCKENNSLIFSCRTHEIALERFVAAMIVTSKVPLESQAQGIGIFTSAVQYCQLSSISRVVVWLWNITLSPYTYLYRVDCEFVRFFDSAYSLYEAASPLRVPLAYTRIVRAGGWAGGAGGQGPLSLPLIHKFIAYDVQLFKLKELSLMQK